MVLLYFQRNKSISRQNRLWIIVIITELFMCVFCFLSFLWTGNFPVLQLSNWRCLIRLLLAWKRIILLPWLYLWNKVPYNNFNKSKWSGFESKWTFTHQNAPQTFILTSTKPPRYVITTITTLGCPINPTIGLEYGRKCQRKLVQVRNAVRLTQRLFMKTPIRF